MRSGCDGGCRQVSLIRLKAYRSSRQKVARQGKAGEWHVGDSGRAALVVVYLVLSAR